MMNILKSIFKNKNGKLRSGWRITIILAVFIATMVALSWANYIIIALCDLTAILVAIRLLDKKTPADIGFTNFFSGAGHFFTGLLAGAVSISIVFAVLLLSGSVYTTDSLSRPVITTSLLTGLLMFIGTGFLEEAFSRGYCITVLKETCSVPAAILISSVLFALLHITNLNVSVTALVNILLVGILLSLMFIRTGSLWMPIGYHITWNYFQGNIFGFAVSGNDQAGIYTTKPHINDILNGGGFGPEGGLVVTAIIAAGIIIELILAKRRRNENEGRNWSGQPQV